MQAKHLAIVRATLTFWDEEMASVPETVYQHYLHSKDQGTLITPDDVVEARSFFNEAKLKYALIDLESNELVPGQLATLQSEFSCQSNQRIVSVLIG